MSTDYHAKLYAHELTRRFASNSVERFTSIDYAIYKIVGPSGETHLTPSGTSWRFTKDRFKELVKDNRMRMFKREDTITNDEDLTKLPLA